jgi:hypothetical protein
LFLDAVRGAYEMAFARVSPSRAVGLAAASAGLALVGTIGVASPAFANSFSGSDSSASWSYNDGADSFCVTGKNGNGVYVKLRPVTAGRGPSYDTTVRGGSGKRCFSLATAYEDTRYSYAVGTATAYHTGYFYS